MQETEIKFERENLEGIIPVGTYLLDAAGRMGVELWREPFGETGEAQYAVVKITKGGELLSAPTKIENEFLSDARRGGGERLAEQTKIEGVGEITIMTTEKPKEAKPDYETKKEEYRKEFEELPLEKKIASLIELEAIALGDTFSFVINSPYKIFGKLVDVLAELGFKIEDEAKKQARPAEHQAENPPPSVRDEETEKNPSPSLKDESAEKDPLPSVQEETDNPPPSIRETEAEQDPPPSV